MRAFQHAGLHRLELVVLERPDEMPRFGRRRCAVAPDGRATGERWELFDTEYEMMSGLTPLCSSVNNKGGLTQDFSSVWHKGLVFQKCLMSRMLASATEEEQAYWKEQAPLFQLDPDAKIIRAQVYAPRILRAFRKEPATYTQIPPDTQIPPGTWGAVVETVVRPAGGQVLLVSWPDAEDAPALPTDDDLALEDRAARSEDRDERSRSAAARGDELRVVKSVHSGEAGKWTVLLRPKRTRVLDVALVPKGEVVNLTCIAVEVDGQIGLSRGKEGVARTLGVLLADKSGASIRVTFWERQAQSLWEYTHNGSPNPNPVMEITAVVGTCGRSASARSARILTDSPEARAARVVQGGRRECRDAARPYTAAQGRRSRMG
jgi:hypothetical protein